MSPLYPSDLTDAQWLRIMPLVPAAKPGGRPRSVGLRAVLDGIFYLSRAGCAWRYSPREYGPRSTVYHYFRTWRDNAGALWAGWERIHARLRERVRLRSGREPTPSAAIIDSQSAKATEQGGPHGFDGGKKVNGRKRHILVDTMGLVLKAVVHPADLHDREGGKLVLGSLGEQFPRLVHVWADQGYAGAFRGWAKAHTGIDAEVVYPWWRQLKRYAPEMLEELGYRPGFNVPPRRWVVEPGAPWAVSHGWDGTGA